MSERKARRSSRESELTEVPPITPFPIDEHDLMSHRSPLPAVRMGQRVVPETLERPSDEFGYSETERTKECRECRIDRYYLFPLSSIPPTRKEMQEVKD